MREEPEEYECSYQDDLVCPYCGHIETDSWETPDNATEGSCNSCGKDYKIEQEFSRTFSTYKTCQEDEACTFGPWQKYGTDSYRECKLCNKREWQIDEQA